MFPVASMQLAVVSVLDDNLLTSLILASSFAFATGLEHSALPELGVLVTAGKVKVRLCWIEPEEETVAQHQKSPLHPE